MQHETQKYNAGARGFHWATALLILGLLPAGFYMVVMEFSPFKLQIYGLHKSLGLTVLILAVFRILWRGFFKPPSSLGTHKAWEKALSKTIHIVLYVAIVMMPLSGWVMSSAGDFPVTFFGLFDVPNIVPKNENIFETSRSVHTVLGFIIVGCLGLHIVGALKHHFIDKDATLARMGGHVVYGFLGLAALGVVGVIWITPSKPKEVSDEVSQIQNAQAEVAFADLAEGALRDWVIDSVQSTIGFSYRQYGSVVQGAFESFEGRVVFDPDDLSAAQAEIRIQAASIKTGSDDRDLQARSGLWFDAQTYPDIVFTSERFVALGPNRYEVFGTLKIRDAALPVSFPFNLEIQELDDGRKQAVMNGELVLQRLDFGVGQGQWQGTDAIANEVNVTLVVHATR